jgi:hypothetical protein
MNIRSLLRKKPLHAYEDDIKTSELKRSLGKWELTAIGIGAVIGGGIFVLTGVASHQHTQVRHWFYHLFWRELAVYSPLFVMRNLPVYYRYPDQLMPILMEPWESSSHGLLVGTLF